MNNVNSFRPSDGYSTNLAMFSGTTFVKETLSVEFHKWIQEATFRANFFHHAPRMSLLTELFQKFSFPTLDHGVWKNGFVTV
jgi:hypothetical protein